MLGKGLESLIPKKPQGQRGDDYGFTTAVPADPFGAYAPQPTTPQSAPRQPVREFTAAPAEFSDPMPAREEYPQPSPVQTGSPRRSESEAGEKIPQLSGPIFHIEIDKIEINPYQPRTVFDEQALRELAASIREYGIIQPLVVAKLEEETEYGTRVRYQLIAGHRRLLASKMLGLSTVPVVIRNAMKKTEALEMAIVENIQRADLNIIETARAYARLSDEFGLTQREVAQRLGKSREAVANALRLLSLSSEIQDALVNGRVNESQARLLMSIEDQIRQQELFRQLTEENLSVRELKRRIDGEHKPEPESALATVRDNEPLQADDLQMRSLEKEIAEIVGAPVKIEFSRSGGKIVIHFYSPEEAMGIAQRIKPLGTFEM